jgi:putative ABC transport system substrate-binding protein
VVRRGGLLSYGVDYPTLVRRSAFYIDRILRGAKPSDLPVERPTVFRLTLNVKAAAALGVTLPTPLLARADEVIE